MATIKLYTVVGNHFGELAGMFVKEIMSGRLGDKDIKIESANIEVKRRITIDVASDNKRKNIFNIRKGWSCARFEDGKDPEFYKDEEQETASEPSADMGE